MFHDGTKDTEKKKRNILHHPASATTITRQFYLHAVLALANGEHSIFRTVTTSGANFRYKLGTFGHQKTMPGFIAGRVNIWDYCGRPARPDKVCPGSYTHVPMKGKVRAAAIRSRVTFLWEQSWINHGTLAVAVRVDNIDQTEKIRDNDLQPSVWRSEIASSTMECSHLIAIFETKL